MFLGEHLQKLDEKGRVSIPAAFRKVIADAGQEQVILTRSKDTCLMAHTMAGWERLLAEWADRPSLDPELEAFERVYLASAWPAEVDRQGRILIPAPLRAHALLEREAVFAGRGGKFEIWQPARWEEARSLSVSLLTRAARR